MVDSELLSECTERLMQDVIDLRKEIGLIPIHTDPVSFNQAASLCTIGTTGNDVSTLLSLQEQADRADSMDQKIEKYFMYGIILMIIGIIPLIYYMVMKG